MTTRPYRALVLDDDPKWRSMLDTSLTRAGFQVGLASSPEEMEAELEKSFYHLLVFDISMDGSRTNRSGLDVLAELHNRRQTDASVVVIVTSHASPLSRAREAFRDYKAFDVVEKQTFDNLDFVRHVREALATSIHANRSLEVKWNGPPDAASDAVVNLRIDGRRIRKKDAALHERLVIELDDLLTRTFSEASMIIVTPMQRGRSGSGVLRVEPFYNGGGGRPVVLKFGDVTEIQTEMENYQHYVKLFLGGGRTTTVVCAAQTPMLGGIGYSLLGTEEFESFTSFYRRSTTEGVAASINNLFLGTCGPWYSNPGRKLGRDLGAEYRERLGCTEENVSEHIQKLKNVRCGPMLTFDSLPDFAVRNPLKAAFGESMVEATYECVTHGDLNDGNILVDHTGDTWLIDFLQTGPGHVLRDFALLDVTVRCCLSGPEEADLTERRDLELALLQATTLDAAGNVVGHLASANEHMRKAFMVCLRLRALAAKQVHHYANAEMRDYSIACLFYALNLTRFMHLETVQREHALLAAALLAERLHS